MSFTTFKTFAPFSALVSPLLSLVGFGLSILGGAPALDRRTQAQLSASFIPSRPPPPPPPPPQTLPPGNDGQDGDSDGDDANGGDGDDNPPQDDAADEDGVRDGDGLAVGAAPAPEDPPPPAGDVEEDGGDTDEPDSLSDSGLSWLLLLLLGKIVTRPFTGTGKVNIERAIVKPGPVKPTIVDASASAIHPLSPASPQVRLFPSWAKTYFKLVLIPALVFVLALLRLLLVPPPFNRYAQEQEQDVAPELEQVVVPEPEDRQEEAPNPPAEPIHEEAVAPPPERRQEKAPDPPPPDHQEHPDRHDPVPDLPPNPQENSPDLPPATDPGPTPEWKAARERIRLALFQNAPGPAREEDQAARAQAVSTLQRMAARRAALPAAQEDTERKRWAEVRRVQRCVWVLLCELAFHQAEEIHEEVT
ncbi:hypothetical protein FB451DRAFT_1554303 [Mycena latifolia]|nr:hypothetical protein FB451DRAFT_1554303 [Mycena latifolia]